MSLFCPLAKCKEEKGPCRCEKAMSVIVVLAAFAGLYHHFITAP